MNLYGNAGPEGSPADMNQQFAGFLNQAEFAGGQRYAAPLVGTRDSAYPAVQPTDDPGATTGPPTYYNYQAAPPMKYDVPTQQKERMVARQAIRQAIRDDANVGGLAGAAAVPRPDPIDSEEVDYLQSMKATAEMADFDQYVNALVDPRKPGNLKWLMEIYPEFVNRRLSQVHTDYEYALRNQLIDQWGINTFDDLHFKYLVDQGKINGPSLRNPLPAQASGYSAGYLSPFNPSFQRIKMEGTRLPFASARFGRGARTDNDWRLDDDERPLGTNRGMREMAASIFGSGDRSGGANANDDEADQQRAQIMQSGQPPLRDRWA